MQFQIYDFSLRKYYYKKSERNWGWTCFKTEGTKFNDIEEARSIIKYHQTFSSNEFKILTLKPVTIRMKGRTDNASCR